MKGLFGGLILLLAAFLPGKHSTASAAPEVDFDKMLSGMTREVNLDNVLSGMTGEVNFDALLSGMGSGGNIDDIASSMAVDRTLDYLSGIYTSPVSTSVYGNYEYQGISLPQYAGMAMLPVSGSVTSRFGYRPSFKRMHKGVDISLQVGDTVRAALDGRVSRVDVDPKGYGLFVVIRHSNGLETRYGHLSRALVGAGAPVMAGDAIALGGNSGNSTGPHLHFETRQNGAAFDPTTMFDFSMPTGMICNRSLSDLDQTPANSPVRNGKSTYIVKAGDTIGSVSRDFGISVLTLCRLNMLATTDALQPGRMLKLR